MQKLPGHIFRANDIRGVADIDLSEHVVRRIAGGFGLFLEEKGVKSLGIGYDVRLTSPRIFKAYIDELSKFSLRIFDLGMIPSPVGYFVNHHIGKVESVSIITASHNPSEYNGIKFCVKGKSMTQDCVKHLAALSESYELRDVNLATIQKLDAKKSYIEYVSNLFSSNENLKVAIDTANATAGLIVPELLKEIGQNFEIINEELDGSFPNHHPDPTVERNMIQLSELVLNTGADVGFGFDGDSDRIGVVDDKGRFIPGDILTALFAKDVIAKIPGASIVIEVKSSQLLIDTIEEAGGQVQMSRVGHSFIKEKISESNAMLAGELSGHMFFCDNYFGFDDAFYCMLRLIDLLKEKGKKLSELIDEFPEYYNTPEIHLAFENDNQKFETFSKIKDLFDSQDNVNRIDGLRIMFDDGWGLIRPSNTQPVIVTRYEGKSNETLQKIKQEIEQKIFKVFKGKVRTL